MKNSLILVIFLAFLSNMLTAQNVGQEGDTLVNYVDINGFKQGKWQKEWASGKIKYTAYFVDNKPVGDFKRYDRLGNLYAHLNYDKKGENATVTFFHRSGKIATTGFYFEKTKNGVWKYFDEQGRMYLQESFKMGLKHGLFKQITSEGITIEETNYVDGVLNGVWKKYYTNGQLMWESAYVNGKLEGDSKAYFRDGKVYRKGAFVNDLMEGAWLSYSENGTLQKVYQYKKGVSPESEAEKEEFMKKLMEGKGKYPGPRNSNDLDWLRSSLR